VELTTVAGLLVGAMNRTIYIIHGSCPKTGDDNKEN
jgi:hypothetical protein